MEQRRSEEGGFYFHPGGEGLSQGTPERKKPLERCGSLYTNSESALAVRSSSSTTPAARVQEGIGSLAGYARVFYNSDMLSGTGSRILLICGPCADGAGRFREGESGRH